jgi:hypothetical protein
MVFDALDELPRGLCVVLFDGTDRLQHMFWRDIAPTHHFGVPVPDYMDGKPPAVGGHGRPTRAGKQDTSIKVG